MIALSFIVFVAFLILISFSLSQEECGGRHKNRVESYGEKRVAKKLRRLSQDVYRVINNIMLPTVDGTTTQIDHVVVSRYGIFVIETKNFSGWIFGSKDQRTWAQVFRKGYCGESKKFYFQNPIRQNWRHIYVLSDCLELPRRYFFNLVVFSGDGKFKTDRPENVMYRSELCSYIRSFDRPILSDAMVERIVSKLIAIDEAIPEESRCLHVSNLMATHDPMQMSIACENGSLRCPKCGGKMVLRHRKSDGATFYGCTNYPDCRGTRQA